MLLPKFKRVLWRVWPWTTMLSVSVRAFEGFQRKGAERVVRVFVQEFLFVVSCRQRTIINMARRDKHNG